MSLYQQITTDLAGFYDKIKQYVKGEDLSQVWIGNIVQTLDKLIANDDPFDRKLQAIHSGEFYGIQNKVDVNKFQNRWWIDYLSNAGMPIDSFAPEIQEADIVDSMYKMTLPSGRSVTPDFMRRVSHISYVKKYLDIPDGRFDVLELGAGYCGFARLFKIFYPGCRYTVIDIPHTLYFGAGFIKACFPDAKVLLVGSPEDYEQADLSAYDFVFMPAGLQHLLHGRTFDLFVNTHSMGEMPNHVIDGWFDLIQNKMDVKRVFMLNRYLNRPFAEWRNRENKGSVSFDPHWTIRYWEFEPPFMRCPFTETIENQCALVMADRIPQELRNPEDYQAKAREDEIYVMNQDWFKFTNTNNPFTALGKPFVQPERIQDFTMNGTLFLLWNSVRLHPTVINTTIMVQYLRYINYLGTPFEEVGFYQQVYFQCTQQN